MNFSARLDGLLRKRNTFLTVGLDPRPGSFPTPLKGMETEKALNTFLEGIVKATSPHCVAYKMQFASFLAFGEVGLKALFTLPGKVGRDHLTILDIKAGDIPSTMELYRDGVFGRLGFDAMTVHPFLGWESVEAVLKYEERGTFVLLHTSNPGSSDIQESLTASGVVLWKTLMPRIRKMARNGNVGAVVGATYPDAIASARAGLGPEVPLLVPGVGTQGAKVEDVIAAARGSSGGALLVNSSRGILFASKGKDWKRAAGKEAERLTRQMRTVPRPSVDRALRAGRRRP